MLRYAYNLNISPCVPAVALYLLSAAVGTLHAAQILEGPVSARLERVIDGDTLAVKARIWVGQEIRVFVRVNGVDTPELRSKCVHERRLAQFAKRYVVDWMQAGEMKLTNIRRGKYAGRIIADVFDTEGHKLADDLLHAGLGSVYFGGKKINWCHRSRLQANPVSAVTSE